MKGLVLALALTATSTAGYSPRELRLWQAANRATTLAETRTIERDVSRARADRLQADLEALAAQQPPPCPQAESNEVRWFLVGGGAGIVVGVLGAVVAAIAVR